MKLLYSTLCSICLLAFSGSSMAELEKLFSYNASGVQITADQAGHYVYIPDQSNSALVVVNSSTLEVEQTISLPGIPQDIALDEASGVAYIALRSFSSLHVLDLNTYQFLDPIALPQAANEVVVGNSSIFATTYTSGSGIMRIDRSINAYVDSFSEGVFTYARGALELTPDKSKLVFANRGLSPGTLAVFDLSASTTPTLLIKNGHGDLGGNGQNISVDPINGAFVSYAVGGGNGAGYSIAKLDIADLSWQGEFTTGAYPGAVHFSKDGYSTYTNNTANSVQIWDSNTMGLLNNFSVMGNPKDFVDLQNNALVGVISDKEFAIYKVRTFTPEPPAPKLEGDIIGMNPTTYVCKNQDTGQRIVISAPTTSFNCIDSGLNVATGERVRIVIKGIVE